jgi:hypothetical protein
LSLKCHGTLKKRFILNFNFEENGIFVKSKKMKKLILCLITILICGSCVFSSENNNPIIIDKDIQKKVESEIIDSVPTNQNRCELDYLNRFNPEFYSNDSLKYFSIKNQFKPFWSSWGIKGDTMKLYGFFNFGEGGEIGFEMNKTDRIPQVYLSIYAGMMSMFSPTKDGEIERITKVPTKTSKITFSEMPNSSRQNTVYGLIEFESKDFFKVTKYENGKEIPNQRERVRMNMKIYFKANRCDSTFYGR